MSKLLIRMSQEMRSLALIKRVRFLKKKETKSEKIKRKDYKVLLVIVQCQQHCLAKLSKDFKKKEKSFKMKIRTFLLNKFT